MYRPNSCEFGYMSGESLTYDRRMRPPRRTSLVSRHEKLYRLSKVYGRITAGQAAEWGMQCWQCI